MKREQIIEQGMRLLNDVHDDEHFKTVDGQTLRSVRELVLLLETYHDEHFRHHVNEHRNDFAAWIEHSVGDPTLAERIRRASTPVRIQQEIAARLEEIENNLLSFEKEPVEEPPIEKPRHEPRSSEEKRRSEDERSEEEQPEGLPEEVETVERDELLEEIERSIAQARAQLEIERAQEMREPEDLSGEPEGFEDEDEEKPITKPQGKIKRGKKGKPTKATKKPEESSSDFSLKDFFIGFAFGALIGGVLGAIIGLMFL
jgi:hypothetical protein